MTTLAFPSGDTSWFYDSWFIEPKTGLFLAFLAGFIGSAFTLQFKKYIQRKNLAQGKNYPLLVSWPFLAIQILLLIRWRPIHWVGNEFGWHPLFLLVAGLGWIDDWLALSGKMKLPLLAMAWIGLCISTDIQQGFWWTPLSIISIYSLIGFFALLAIPLIDGINGLMIGYLIICSLASSVSFYINVLTVASPIHFPLHFISPWSSEYRMESFVGMVLLATMLLGVLVWNFPKGRLRLGEMAILPLAMYISHQLITAAVTWVRLPISTGSVGGLASMPTLMSPVAWTLLCYPILDMALVFISRIRNRRSPFRGGHDHLHHRLIQTGWSSTTTTIAILSGVFILAVAIIADDIASLVHLRTLVNIPEFKDVHILRYIWVGALPLLYLFWRGYTKVNPYKSGAVVVRGRP